MSRGVTLTRALESAGFLVLDSRETAAGTEFAVGSAGQTFWDAVTASPEWHANPNDPVDAFTRRAIKEALAGYPEAQITFVFDADAPNFVVLWTQTFARIAQSDLGLMIHPEYGLWMAARAHVVLPRAQEAIVEDDSHKSMINKLQFDPCASCRDKPCLSACPVGAFTAPKTFDFQACADYLLRNPRCFSAGCDARASCPYGQSWQLPPDQAHYHQNRFRKALGSKS